MERELKHIDHEHPLTLKVGERKVDDGTHHPDMKVISCAGCSEPISGPFYSCEECKYFLHKVCAELPNEMIHPMHPEHPLTLLYRSPYKSGAFWYCDMCRGSQQRGFVYNCSLCEFDVDLICASASLTIEDKCHKHPLTPLQLLIPFPCHICRTKENGFSYKCNTCPFWVHQNCTLLLPRKVKHDDHDHDLTLLQSVPLEYKKVSRNCDICHDRIAIFHCVYNCEPCKFFAHVSCATSREAPQSTKSRDQNIRPALLPAKQKTTDLISWFAEHYTDRDPITNLILEVDESFVDRDNHINKEIIKFSSHEHPLILIDDQVSEVICDACALPICTPSPSYGCINCGYFIHKWCAELPNQILHPAHPQHLISLDRGDNTFQLCYFCDQWSNGFGYKCFGCDWFVIDIKCASLLRPVKHEAHKHPLSPTLTSSVTSLYDLDPKQLCTACDYIKLSNRITLKCNKCYFNLCFERAMMPPMIKHRYDEHPFVLTYSPPENCNTDLICDLCENDLDLKRWFYHCSHCDQFTHTYCMRTRVSDSNIKYGKSYKFEDHEHELTLVCCTHSGSLCDKCNSPMRTGCSIGFECIPCALRIHLMCALNVNWLLSHFGIRN